MGLYREIQEKIEVATSINSDAQLEPVGRHISRAYYYLDKYEEENDAEYCLDSVTRTNLAFEGILRRAYSIFTDSNGSSTKKLSEIEKILKDTGVLEGKIPDLFVSYRRWWRNPSTHDCSLTYSHYEALHAVNQVSTFIIIILKQVIEKFGYSKTKASLESKAVAVEATPNVEKKPMSAPRENRSVEKVLHNSQVSPQVELVKTPSKQKPKYSAKPVPMPKFDCTTRLKQKKEVKVRSTVGDGNTDGHFDSKEHPVQSHNGVAISSGQHLLTPEEILQQGKCLDQQLAELLRLFPSSKAISSNFLSYSEEELVGAISAYIEHMLPGVEVDYEKKLIGGETIIAPDLIVKRGNEKTMLVLKKTSDSQINSHWHSMKSQMRNYQQQLKVKSGVILLITQKFLLDSEVVTSPQNITFVCAKK
ncbi:MAG: hypothetical protein CL942_16015 [Desulfovibrio sp.]|nr:hypothetical protein [Desulfovibrio sp.]